MKVVFVSVVYAEKERREGIASWFKFQEVKENEVGECFSPLYNPLMSNSQNALLLTTNLVILHNYLFLISSVFS
jgi:hypothetical protein